MLNDLLFELGTEELPSMSVWPLADCLANNVVQALIKAEINHGHVARFATPRRIALLIKDVAANQAPQNIARKGPSFNGSLDEDGQPTKALLGFAKSCGVTIAELKTSKTEKGEWWVYEATTKGAKTVDIIPTILTEAIAALPIAKPMRWGNGDALFARPVHWAVLLFGEEVINCNILSVATGRQSYGHRFHHPSAIDISSPLNYENQLKEAFIIPDFAERRKTIIEQVESLAKNRGFTAVMNDSLLDEVTSIVEWPQALLASFEEKFLEVPAEVLIAAMQSHQKCFALRDKDNNLVPYFITVANIASSDKDEVILGNEKVMRARLSDAAFFYDKDKLQPLIEYQKSTASVVFQERLGSLQDKINRLKALMEYLSLPLELSLKKATRAAVLSKCDLMTGMVGEFPELQGLMGYYYAVNDQEDNDVAIALNEQYMPRFAADHLPETSLGLALSLADRLDTLVGSFAIGNKPTGVKDPFKSRRHALAIVRLLINIPTAINLSTLINHTLQIYGSSIKTIDNEVILELKPFILERLVSFYQAKGIPQSLVMAVRARQDDWFFDIDKRINALNAFIKLEEAAVLSALCKRVNNLLQHKSLNLKVEDFNLALLENPFEKELFDNINHVEQIVAPLYSSQDYGLILTNLATLRKPIDNFFDNVMVMADNENLKLNRLSLLLRLQNLLHGVAELSLL